jgi:hypothetical protein
MWVLILFYFNGGSPAVAMHDFSNKTACEQATVNPGLWSRGLSALGHKRT